jgi:hypothetical protein
MRREVQKTVAIPSHRTTRRQGAVLIYAMIVMVAVSALCSLAVDYGRVQLAKTQLSAAADAAARYAVTGLADGTYQSKAIAVAAQNNVDGTAMVLNGSDVTAGTWANNTFTPGGSSPNAVQINAVRSASRGNGIALMYGAILGARSCDIHAMAIASLTPQPSGGIIGLGGLKMSGGAYTDSYDSSLGTYASQTPGRGGNVLSNGDIQLSGGAIIHGNATPGPGHAVTGGTVTGSRTSATSCLNEPVSSVGNAATVNDNAKVAAYMKGGSFKTSASTHVTMPAGTYYFRDFLMSGQSVLNVTGPVTIYVTGVMDISGQVTTAGNLPSNLKIRVTSTSQGKLSGGSSFYCDLYAPLAPLDLSGGTSFYGSIIGASLNFSGNAGIHYDVSLSSGTTNTIALVK